jgi:microcystin degradation protein MlrC
MSTGLEVRLGPTAVLELDGADGGRVQVVVTTHRYQALDLGVFRSQGIEPTAQKILGRVPELSGRFAGHGLPP